MGFAGLWDGFKRPDGMETRTITVATCANKAVGELHDRIG
jgi:putative SOS response-associated peptidase YedK